LREQLLRVVVPPSKVLDPEAGLEKEVDAFVHDLMQVRCVFHVAEPCAGGEGTVY
jgi:hypothetical protein